MSRVDIVMIIVVIIIIMTLSKRSVMVFHGTTRAQCWWNRRCAAVMKRAQYKYTEVLTANKGLQVM